VIVYGRDITTSPHYPRVLTHTHTPTGTSLIELYAGVAEERERVTVFDITAETEPDEGAV
jgi:hypothetical protein